MKRSKTNDTRTVVKTAPAIDPEVREKQLIAKAIDLVEERLDNGTASSQEVTHFLRLGSTKNREELEKLRNENKLLAAKTEALKAQQNSNELFAKAMANFARYSGNNVDMLNEYGDGNEDTDF